MLVTTVVTLVLAVAWLLGPQSGTDLAAQQARAGFASAYPLGSIDLRWFGGVKPLAYSVLTPYAMAAVGVRLCGAIAAVISGAAIGGLLARWRVRHALPAALWCAVVLVLDLVDGRVTYAIGLAVGLLALLAIPRPQTLFGARPSRWRWVPAAVLSVLTALCSPVAAGFLALVALGWALHQRGAVALVVAALVPLGVLAVIAPEPGLMLDTWPTALRDFLAAAAVVVFCRGKALRTIAGVYALGVLVIYVHPAQIGSNIERLSMMFAGPALICCFGRFRFARTIQALCLVALAVWTVRIPLQDFENAPALATEQDASHRLVDILHTLPAMTGRVEVVPFRDHAESDIVADSWPLARGWERQVDILRSSPLYRGRLTPARYLAWLDASAVQYVALGRHPHDFGALHELALLRHPPPYLTPVFTGPEWTVWRVDGATPIVSSPGTLTGYTGDSVHFTTSGPGTVDVAVRWSHLWSVTNGSCLARAPQDHVEVRVPRAETVTLSATYEDPQGGARCG